ncbi:hypothetical protein OAN307_c01910 [Octadecabacter antarcticus 307]|uniref:Uncharacterized protein n=2 Tax=Octadecabacter TaxID=53945 RepID=M9R2J2_9RHOB|nr:hypothetical protein OAN307_c01910 [Octadecabacter antarcticus 307]
MTRNSKKSTMSFMGRLHGKRSVKALRKSGNTVTAGFVTSAPSAVTSFKTVSHRKRLPNDSLIAPKTDGETAIVLIQEALVGVEEAASQIDLPAAERYSGLSAFKSDDMWFGNPKNMPDEDIAFFELET